MGEKERKVVKKRRGKDLSSSSEVMILLMLLYFCMHGLLVGFSNLGCQHVFLIIVKQKGQLPIIDGSLELNVG